MSDPFDKLLMLKVECVYNLRIIIVMKRKVILVKNVIQQTNQYVFILFWDDIDSQIVYKMLLLYILWLDEQR